MSTIEKAVSKLAKRTDASVEGLQSLESLDQKKSLDTSFRQDVDECADSERNSANGDVTDFEEPAYVAKQLHSGLENPSAIKVKIPFDDLNSLGMVTHLMPRSEIAEAYRIIKRPLLMNMSGASAVNTARPNLIMVTSSVEGEGKTFSAISLAMSIAMEQDKTVLFVDADVAKASAGALLDLPDNTPGLIDVLEDENIDIGDVIMPTNVANLRIIGAGRLHERSTELLASESMELIMEELSQRYANRVVIFDSPPLLRASEASVLANLMGQIVFVVAANSTPKSAITEALQHIGEDKLVGTLLNKVPANSLSKLGYGYGYGYGYGRRQNDQLESNPGREQS